MSERMSREELYRKIKLLKATAERGGSEQEMETAARLIATLVAKYNLDLSELDEDDDVVFDATEVAGKYNETWRKTCFELAGAMYFCKYLFRSNPRSKTAAITHILIGEEHNRAVAAEMGAYFESTINRLANNAARLEHDETLQHTGRHRFIRSFRLAAAQRLSERVYTYVRSAKKGGAVKAEDGTTLPALQSLYDQLDDMYDKWLALQPWTVTAGRESRDQALSRKGREQGRLAADQISLSTQVGGSSSKFALR